MFTLSQVIEGLKQGTTYTRPIALQSGSTGEETLTPTPENRVRHDVAGNHPLYGGWGGSNEIDIGLVTTCWRLEEDGWELSA